MVDVRDLVHLTDDELRAALPSAWSSPDHPLGFLSQREWLAHWRRAGFVSDTGLLAPTEPLQIYRGSSWDRRRLMSWTTDLGDETRGRRLWTGARNFAHQVAARGKDDGHVFACVIDPAGVLARISEERPGEAEVVVDPRHLPRLGRDTILETITIEEEYAAALAGAVEATWE